MADTDEAGTWYEMRIHDHQKAEWTRLARLRFPLVDGGLPFLKDGGGSWCEVHRGTKSSRDIGRFHLNYGGVYTCGRTVTARQARISYSDRAPNSDVSIDPDGRSVHVLYGGETKRRTKPGTYPLRPERP